MFFIFSKNTSTTFTELSRYPKRVFHRLNRFQYMYITFYSTGVGILFSPKKLEEIKESLLKLQKLESLIEDEAEYL